MKRAVLAAIVSGLVSAVAYAGMGMLETIYRNDVVSAIKTTTTNDFVVTYTNTTGERVAIGSIFAASSVATGSWSILIINNNQTNTLVSATALTFAVPGIKYEGYGTVPLGNGGKLMLIGSVASNSTLNGMVKWQINTLNAQ